MDFGVSFDPGQFVLGIADMVNSNSQAEKNRQMQYDFAKNQTQWKVADAKAAGVHPLAALGQSYHSTPTYDNGASIAGASNMSFKTTDPLVKENQQLQNDLLREQIKEQKIANAASAGSQNVVSTGSDATNGLLARDAGSLSSALRGQGFKPEMFDVSSMYNAGTRSYNQLARFGNNTYPLLTGVQFDETTPFNAPVAIDSIDRMLTFGTQGLNNLAMEYADEAKKRGAVKVVATASGAGPRIHFVDKNGNDIETGKKPEHTKVGNFLNKFVDTEEAVWEGFKGLVAKSWKNIKDGFPNSWLGRYISK